MNGKSPVSVVRSKSRSLTSNEENAPTAEKTCLSNTLNLIERMLLMDTPLRTQN